MSFSFFFNKFQQLFFEESLQPLKGEIVSFIVGWTFLILHQLFIILNHIVQISISWLLDKRFNNIDDIGSIVICIILIILNSPPIFSASHHFINFLNWTQSNQFEQNNTQSVELVLLRIDISLGFIALEWYFWVVGNIVYGRHASLCPEPISFLSARLPSPTSAVLPLFLISLLEEQIAGFHVARKDIAMFESNQPLVHSNRKLPYKFSANWPALLPMDPDKWLQTEMLQRCAIVQFTVAIVVGLGFEVVDWQCAHFFHNSLDLHGISLHVDLFDDDFSLGLLLVLWQVEAGVYESVEIETLGHVDSAVVESFVGHSFWIFWIYIAI